MTTEHEGPTGILVHTRVFAWAFLLRLFKTTVAIDGVEQILPWGGHTFYTSPGEHEVRVSFDYLGVQRTAENSIQVMVPAGSIVRVSYQSPLLLFLMKGRIKVIQ